jgi:UDP-N-acetylglucosamine/UDP-N-acetylgalactosamine 4-epimerase
MKNVHKLLAGRRFTWLVTGAAGFIGSNLCLALLKLNQRVIGLDSFVTGRRSNIANIQQFASTQGVEGIFAFIEGDVRNLADCQSACKHVDFVLHQAALGSIPRSINNPLASHASNVDGFINILDAARLAAVKRFVYASSSSVYGDAPGLPKVEHIVGNPLSPYAATKSINEVYAKVFARTYGFSSTGLRYFNVFGPRQDPEGAYAAVVPKWIDAVLSGRQIVVNGDGSTSRDFCFIENVVQANLLSALCTTNEGLSVVYNVAYGQRTTLLELVKLIDVEVRRLRPDLIAHPLGFTDFRKGDVLHSLADISSANAEIGYQPTHSLQQGMRPTVEWFVAKGDNE